MNWFYTDLILVCLYGFLHSILTTRPAVAIIGKIFKPQLWNFVFSIISVLTLVVAYVYWQPSGVEIYRTEGIAYYVMCGLSFNSLIFFFYCFRYTSFTQWLGVAQLYRTMTGKPEQPYYKINKSELKRYVRFPHHTALIFLFWAQPVMTQDTLLLAIGATFYTWIGTVHQDRRGLRLLGQAWQDYRQESSLLFPSVKQVLRDIGLSGNTASPAAR